MNDDYMSDINNAETTQRTLRPQEPAAETEMQQEMVENIQPAADVLEAVCCPFCGEMMDADADYCESCHRYVNGNVCSYCGTALSGEEDYCSECGNPRGGLVCPACHTMNDFAFCKQCGTPLTDEAKAMVAEMMQHPDFIELKAAVEQMSNLENCLPYTSERDIVCKQMNEKLRERVLTLLAKDRGEENPEVRPLPETRMSEEQLNAKKEQVIEKVMELLEKLALVKAESPVKARNYCMATKPAGVRLAWVCNYKHAMHSSPCGCAKPHLGGKWVILGRGTKGNIKDDN